MVTTQNEQIAVEEVPLEGEQPRADADLELIPMQRSKLPNIKAMKFSDEELVRLAQFQEWLAVTVNPETGQPFIARNTFAALMQFCLNLAFNQMSEVAQWMTQQQEA